MLSVDKSSIVCRRNILLGLTVSTLLFCAFQSLKCPVSSWDGQILRKRMLQEFNLSSAAVKAVQFIAASEDDTGTDSAKDLPRRRLPGALVIGVKKCGTRALLEFLRVHPDVRAAGSEVHFFDKYYNKGIEWYRERMPLTVGEQVTMEKTPSYFVTREAPRRVRAMNPDVKLLLVVRDPVTRAISDYTQAASKRAGGGGAEEFERLAFVSGDSQVVDTNWGPVRLGLYAHHLQHWLAHFNLTQMLFVSGESLVSDPAAQMELVQDFLGLRRVITEKHFYLNATKGFPCLVRPEKPSTPHCLGRTKGRSHPDVRPSVLSALRVFYRPFNRRFYQMTGVDFGWP